MHKFTNILNVLHVNTLQIDTWVSHPVNVEYPLVFVSNSVFHVSYSHHHQVIIHLFWVQILITHACMLQQVFDVIFCLNQQMNGKCTHVWAWTFAYPNSTLYHQNAFIVSCHNSFLQSSIRHREKLFSSLKLKCRIFNEQVTLLSLDFMKLYLFIQCVITL